VFSQSVRILGQTWYEEKQIYTPLDKLLP